MTRLDEDIEQRYFREIIDHDGVLYTSAAMGPSPHWDDGADAVLLESRDGRTFEAVDSPRPGEVVLAWTVLNGALIAGTNEGTLLIQRGDEWTTVGELPVNGQGIRSLCPDPRAIAAYSQYHSVST